MKELHAVVDADPFGDEVDEPDALLRRLPRRQPNAAKLKPLLDEDFSPDKLAANGRELYAWCPDGMQNSRLMKTLGKPGLAGTATVRNWAPSTNCLE